MSLQLRRARATKLVGGNRHSGQVASWWSRPKGGDPWSPILLEGGGGSSSKGTRPLLALLGAVLLGAVNVLHGLVDGLQVLRVPELQLRVRDVVGAGKL